MRLYARTLSSLHFYCCGKTPGSMQLIGERVYLGLMAPQMWWLWLCWEFTSWTANRKLKEYWKLCMTFETAMTPPPPRVPMTYFLHQGNTSKTCPNSVINWETNIKMPKDMGNMSFKPPQASCSILIYNTKPQKKMHSSVEWLVNYNGSIYTWNSG